MQYSLFVFLISPSRPSTEGEGRARCAVCGVMLPNMSRLGLRIAAPYESSPKDWQDRGDEPGMVLGGCTLGSACYQAFEALLVENMLEAQGNGLTVVMLSVGAGVLELRSLLELESLFPFRIAQVLLVDPGQAEDRAEQVASYFTAGFMNARDYPDKLNLEVEYFCGEDAYAKVMALVDGQILADTFRPAFVAALNYGLGPRWIGDREADGMYRQAFTFVGACLQANKRLHVVTAFQNGPHPFVLRNEPAADYILRQEMELINSNREVGAMTELEHRLASLKLEQEHRERNAASS